MSGRGLAALGRRNMGGEWGGGAWAELGEELGEPGAAELGDARRRTGGPQSEMWGR
jgi:hypothetical protein